MSAFEALDLSSFTGAPFAGASVTEASSSAKQALARRVDEVCRRTGFLAVTGHGVPSEIIDGAWTAARQFFDLPLTEKLEVKMPYEGYPYGYAGLQAEALAKSMGEEAPPDLKESFSIGPLDWSTILGRTFLSLPTNGLDGPPNSETRGPPTIERWTGWRRR
jgi:isopenicillin N synthase-like dioxygenase